MTRACDCCDSVITPAEAYSYAADDSIVPFQSPDAEANYFFCRACAEELCESKVQDEAREQ